MNSNATPYVGPRPFAREDRNVFFGRDFEANEVADLIIAHSAVMLYSTSGAGKSSLLNARVIPLLEEDGHEVLGPTRVGRALAEGLRDDEVPNIYLFNCLKSWAEPGHVDAGALARMSMRDFLNGLPRSGREQDDSYSLRILIFDQFEELFTSHPARWVDRHGFFEQVHDALRDDSLLRVVFVMREDFIANMDPFAPRLPERLRNRFRLERLGKQSALRATVEPLSLTGRRFAPGVAEKLVESLMRISVVSEGRTIEVPGEFVEPVQLQVVCQNLWQSLPPDVRVIEEQFIRDYGDVDAALSAYYETCIRQVAETGIKEGILRRWFEQVLITPEGTRATVYAGDVTAGGLSVKAVQMLDNMHLIRGEFTRGARWYELSNDRFIKPILQSNQRWLNSLGVSEVVRQSLEARAGRWTMSEQSRELLLSENELAEAERLLAEADVEGMGASNTLSAFMQASRASIETGRRQELIARRKIQLLKMWNVTLLILLLLLLVLFLLMFRYASDRRSVVRGAGRRMAAGESVRPQPELPAHAQEKPMNFAASLL